MDYAEKQGWHVTEGKKPDGSLYIEMRNPKASLLRLLVCNDPQIATWRLYPQGEKTRAEMSFCLFPASTFGFYSLFISLFLALEFAAFSFFRHGSDVGALVKLLAITACCIVFHSCIADLRRYKKFRDTAFSLISENYGLRETVIQEGSTFPEFNMYFFLVVSFMLPLLVLGGSLLFDFKSLFISFAVSVFFLLLASLLILSFVALRNPNTGQRVRLVLVGLQGGFIFSLVSFIPLIHLIILPYKNNSGVAYAVFLSVLLLAFLVIFISKNLHDTAAGLRAYLGHYRTAEKNSEFSFEPIENTGSAAAHYAITAMWFLLSLSHVAGLCLLLAVCFHVTRMLPADKIIVFMFAIPIIGFWLVLAYRKIKEAAYFMKLRNSSAVPAWLADKLGSLCVFSGIEEPSIVIDEENSIAANIKFIFPLGIVMRLTRKAIDELGRDELEALLAHEIFHVKRHGLPFAILNFLSEWTVFGGGFLTLSQNSKDMEYDADTFALEWLGRNGKTKDVLISLLDKVSIVNSIGGLAYSQSAMSFVGSGHDKGNQSIHKFIDQLFFGDIILSYVHPTINERIERIMKN
ncbi:MAG: hypothetical protein PHN49_01235 [Candidatus Omnitrophica bacterium]|nr:hypothetical protein [Candidatus Omnitrophota bacterium]